MNLLYFKDVHLRNFAKTRLMALQRKHAGYIFVDLKHIYVKVCHYVVDTHYTVKYNNVL